MKLEKINELKDAEVDQKNLMVTITGDFADVLDRMAVKATGGPCLPSEKEILDNIKSIARKLTEETYVTYSKLRQACILGECGLREETDHFFTTSDCNIWVRLLPSMASYNIYIKMFVKK